MSRLGVACLLVAIASRDPGCGGSHDESGVGSPCTRPHDCAPNATCSAGVCVDLDAGSPDSGDGGDGGD